MFRITRKEEIFFDMFVETVDKSCMAARLLDDLVNDYTDVDNKIDGIEKIEHEGDLLVHDIMKQLNKSFITPIDREDIFEIAKELDNITDSIESTAHRFRMFGIGTITEEARALAGLIVLCTEELKGVMLELKNMKASKSIITKIIEVNRIENMGDNVFRTAITSLLNCGRDAVDVIKWKEIYEILENSLDACEDVANIIEGVIMKHA